MTWQRWALIGFFVLLYVLPVSCLVDSTAETTIHGQFLAASFCFVGGCIVGWLTRDITRED